jgi:hypothetical protein
MTNNRFFMDRQLLNSPRRRRTFTQGQRVKSFSSNLSFEQLEARHVLAVLTVNSVLDNSTPGDGLLTLREAVAAANMNGTPDTIVFAASLSGPINLSTIADSTFGPSALLISSPITIRGNASGITLRPDATTEMRLFRVAAGAGLALDTMMLTEGVARGAAGAPGQNGGDGRGGAIFNQGTVEIRHCPRSVLLNFSGLERVKVRS